LQTEDPVDLIVRRIPKHIWISFGLLAAMLLFSFLFFKAPPSRPTPNGPAADLSETFEARVVSVMAEPGAAGSDAADAQPTQRVVMEILSGSQRGRQVEILHGGRLTASIAHLAPGDRVLVEHSAGGPAGERFIISDFIRLPALLGLAAVFAVAVIAIGGWVGVRALIAMGTSVAVIAAFIVPGIASGHDPLAVCLTGALLLMTASLYLIHRWTWKTHTALLGLAISLTLTAILGALFTAWSRLTGFGSEDAAFLAQATTVPLNLRGIALGAILIGAAGVLDDVVVAQVSTTFELRRANPALTWRQLFARSMVVGRDHIASMVNTLLLAYAGAALPLLLLMTAYSAPLAQTLNREFLAEEIIRTLVGSLGLVLAVPITSVIAALVAHRKGGLILEEPLTTETLHVPS
jgi:uncharacterized membrane protein